MSISHSEYMTRRLAVLGLALAGSLVGLTSPAAAATGTSAHAAQEARVVSLVNAARAKARCGPLRVDGRLVRVARAHSQDMAVRRYFAHNTPGGTTPGQRIAGTGYPRTGWAENIAAGQPNADAVVKAWLASPPHRRNILNCSLRAVGVGYATGGPYRTYWTQDFATR